MGECHSWLCCCCCFFGGHEYWCHCSNAGFGVHCAVGFGDGSDVGGHGRSGAGIVGGWSTDGGRDFVGGYDGNCGTAAAYGNVDWGCSFGLT